MELVLASLLHQSREVLRFNVHMALNEELPSMRITTNSSGSNVTVALVYIIDLIDITRFSIFNIP